MEFFEKSTSAGPLLGAERLLLEELALATTRSKLLARLRRMRVRFMGTRVGFPLVAGGLFLLSLFFLAVFIAITTLDPTSPLLPVFQSVEEVASLVLLFTGPLFFLLHRPRSASLYLVTNTAATLPMAVQLFTARRVPVLEFLQAATLYGSAKPLVRTLVKNSLAADLVVFLFWFFAWLLFCGGIFYALEVFLSGAQALNVPDCFYYSIVTMTTVGYGDISPTLQVTRYVVIVLVIAGFIVIPARVPDTIERFRNRRDYRAPFSSSAKEREEFLVQVAAPEQAFDFCIEFFSPYHGPPRRLAIVGAEPPTSEVRILTTSYTLRGKLAYYQRKASEGIPVGVGHVARVFLSRERPGGDLDMVIGAIRERKFSQRSVSLVLNDKARPVLQKFNIESISRTELTNVLLGLGVDAPGFLTIIQNLIRTFIPHMQDADVPDWVREYRRGFDLMLVQVAARPFEGRTFAYAAGELFSLEGSMVFGLVKKRRIVIAPPPDLKIRASYSFLILKKFENILELGQSATEMARASAWDWCAGRPRAAPPSGSSGSVSLSGAFSQPFDDRSSVLLIGTAFEVTKFVEWARKYHGPISRASFVTLGLGRAVPGVRDVPGSPFRWEDLQRAGIRETRAVIIFSLDGYSVSHGFEHINSVLRSHMADPPRIFAQFKANSILLASPAKELRMRKEKQLSQLKNQHTSRLKSHESYLFSSIYTGGQALVDNFFSFLMAHTCHNPFIATFLNEIQFPTSAWTLETVSVGEAHNGGLLVSMILEGTYPIGVVRKEFGCVPQHIVPCPNIQTLIKEGDQIIVFRTGAAPGSK